MIDSFCQGACEKLLLDPLYPGNEPIFIAIVQRERAGEVIDTLKKYPLGANASIIGEVVADHPNKVIMHSIAGGRRVVSMLLSEALPRIC